MLCTSAVIMLALAFFVCLWLCYLISLGFGFLIYKSRVIDSTYLTALYESCYLFLAKHLELLLANRNNAIIMIIIVQDLVRVLPSKQNFSDHSHPNIVHLHLSIIIANTHLYKPWKSCIKNVSIYLTPLSNQDLIDDKGQVLFIYAFPESDTV